MIHAFVIFGELSLQIEILMFQIAVVMNQVGPLESVMLQIVAENVMVILFQCSVEENIEIDMELFIIEKQNLNLASVMGLVKEGFVIHL